MYIYMPAGAINLGQMESKFQFWLISVWVEDLSVYSCYPRLGRIHPDKFVCVYIYIYVYIYV